jgi:hypothetical protein
VKSDSRAIALLMGLMPAASRAPVVVHALNPWSYAAKLLADGPLHVDNGERAIWLIVSDYNGKHMKGRRMSSWHLSGAALMIWVDIRGVDVKPFLR